jgi:hypothetical protein
LSIESKAFLKSTDSSAVRGSVLGLVSSFEGVLGVVFFVDALIADDEPIWEPVE